MKSQLQEKKNEVKKGSIVIYSDCCNYSKFEVIEVTKDGFTINDKNNGGIVEHLFENLQYGWELEESELEEKINRYEEKMQAKRERFAELAEKREKESTERYELSRKLGSIIPFGQPILVGHHSEKGHRSLINKIDYNMNKSIELGNTAEYYKNKSENYGDSGISSDDPAAVIKLKEKVEKLAGEVKVMKEYNAKIRKFKTKENAIKEVEKMEDCKEKKMFTQMLKNCDYYAFPPDRISAYYFSTTSHNAKIKSANQRIKSLTAKAGMVEKEDLNGDGWKLTENKEDNRIRFIFEGKPELETRTILKSNGFRWSPYNKAWQRMLNTNGRYATKRVIEQLSNE